MESLGLPHVLGLALNIGLGSIMLLLWYFSDRARERELKAYREDTKQALAAYRIDMEAQRQMYAANAALVKTYECLAASLKDIVVLNTQSITRQCDLIINNQFCPNVRLKKELPGVMT